VRTDRGWAVCAAGRAAHSVARPALMTADMVRAGTRWPNVADWHPNDARPCPWRRHAERTAVVADRGGAGPGGPAGVIRSKAGPPTSCLDRQLATRAGLSLLAAGLGRHERQLAELVLISPSGGRFVEHGVVVSRVHLRNLACHPLAAEPLGTSNIAISRRTLSKWPQERPSGRLASMTPVP